MFFFLCDISTFLYSAHAAPQRKIDRDDDDNHRNIGSPVIIDNTAASLLVSVYHCKQKVGQI